MKKIILFLAAVFFILGSVKAFDLNPFAEKKSLILSKEDIEDSFLKDDFNEKYGLIRLSKSFLWSESEKLAEYSLIENTENCLIDCYARGKAILYKDGLLFEDVKFKDVLGRNKLINYTIYVKEKVNRTVEKPIFKQECIEDEKNETNFCYQAIERFENETVEVEDWVDYKFVPKEAGKYEWLIKGKKRIRDSVDFIPLARGKQFSEWAWWNSSFSFCRNIEITDPANLSRKWGEDAVIFSIDSSLWAKKPYNDSIRIINKPCFEDGEELKSEVFNINQNSQGLMNSFNLLIFPNKSNEHKLNYSMYYDINSKGAVNYGEITVSSSVSCHNVSRSSWARPRYVALDRDNQTCVDVGDRGSVQYSLLTFATIPNGYLTMLNDWNIVYDGKLMKIYEANFTADAKVRTIFYNNNITLERTIFQPNANYSVLLNTPNSLVSVTNTLIEVGGSQTSLTGSDVSYFPLSKNLTFYNTASGSDRYAVVWNTQGSLGGERYLRGNYPNYQALGVHDDYATKRWLKSYSNITFRGILFRDDWNYAINLSRGFENPLNLSAISEVFNKEGYGFFEITELNYSSIANPLKLITVRMNYTLEEGRTLKNLLFIYDNKTVQNFNINFLGGRNYSFVSSFILENVSERDAYFYFSFEFTDGNVSNSSIYKQTLKYPKFSTNCSSHPFNFVNITNYLEKNPTNTTSGTVEYKLNFLTSANNEVLLANGTFTGVSFNLCSDTNLSSETIKFNLYLRYYANLMHIKSYNIIETEINKRVTNLSLFYLPTDKGNSFKISYVDFDYLSYPNAIIEIQKEYLDEGRYRIVERPITDANGKTNAVLETERIKYRILVYHRGELKDVFENIQPVCQNIVLGVCDLNLRGSKKKDFLEEEDFLYTIKKTNESIILEFLSKNGTLREVTLTTEQSSRFLKNVSYCEKKVLASSGSLVCFFNKTVGDSLIEIKIRTSDGLYFFGKIKIEEDLNDYFFSNNFFLSFILLMSLSLMFISSGTMLILSGILGIIYLSFIFLIRGFNLFGVVSSIAWLIIAGIIIIYKISQKEEKI